MNKNKIPIWVYGTLKKGFKNHTFADFNKHSTFIGTDSMQGSLYGKKGAYPILCLGDDKIPGELYSVTAEVLGKLINMEEGSGYNTRYAETIKGNMAFYFFVKPSVAKVIYSEFLKYPIKEWALDLDKRD